VSVAVADGSPEGAELCAGVAKSFGGGAPKRLTFGADGEAGSTGSGSGLLVAVSTGRGGGEGGLTGSGTALDASAAAAAATENNADCGAGG